MVKKALPLVVVLGISWLLSGCIVRTYTVTKERPDQDLNVGNRGYIQGKPSVEPTEERKITRSTKVVEVELYPFIRFETKPKHKAPKETVVEEPKTQEMPGNEGYITRAPLPEKRQPVEPTKDIRKYRVQEGDTLQKIAHRFYGATKKWTMIYDANKTTLKGPDKIYPGQVLNIPVDSSQETKETKENLK